MKTIEKMLEEYVSKGMTVNQAENYVCQEIILHKISCSPMADNILIKGGVVMFNLTKDLRRATIDLDFDFIRYDISDNSLLQFIDMLNRYDCDYKVVVNKIQPLHQEDYQGKRVLISISDKTRSINFKLDIGVHTLFGIEQNTACFSFDDEQILLKVNPPEQMFAEKLYSLAKHGALSTRFKDVFDIYYFISNEMLDRKVVKSCIEMLLSKQAYGLKTIDDICNYVSASFEDKNYIRNIKTTKDKWLSADYEVMFKTILDYIYSI